MQIKRLTITLFLILFSSAYTLYMAQNISTSSVKTTEQLCKMESGEIAKHLTDKLNNLLVFTDKQYKKAYKALYKEAVLIKAHTDSSIIKGAQEDRDRIMRSSLKEYQYHLYLNIKDSLYRFTPLQQDSLFQKD